MSTAAGTIPTELREARPLQTFVPPGEGCPIALSVLWIPIPSLPNEAAEEYTRILAAVALSDERLAHNPNNAIRHFLEKTISHEQKFTNFLLTIIQPPPFWLMRYALSVEDWRLSSRLDTEYLLDITIVVNRSPPSEEVLGKLLSTPTAIGLGTYAGLSIVPPQANPFLLLACVSGGIICISTAAGIGRALQDGIYQRLVRCFDDTTGQKEKKKK